VHGPGYKFDNVFRSRDTTEVQGISFVGYTGTVGGRPRLWNLQNLCPVPPYSACLALRSLTAAALSPYR